MNFRPLMLAALFIPSAAFAAVGDPCTPDVTDDQGNVTADNFAERCDGAAVIFCAANDAGDNVETALNCDALFDGAPVGTCQDFGGTTGPNCAFADGDACAFSAGADNPFIPFPCQNADSGCINGQCTASAGTCTAGDPGSCLSGAASFCAPWGQFVGNTCDQWAALDGIDVGGGTLACTGAGLCGGIGTGGDCVDGFYECATDTCTSNVCGGAAEGEGEGEGDDDENDGGSGRDDEPEAAPTGLCSNAAGLAPAFAPVALALIALRRRRR